MVDMSALEELENKDKELRKNLIFVYTETKNLFIEAEELFPDMRFFAAPSLEHRDALEHVMRYLKMTDNNKVSYEAVKQLDNALGHEARAYFDTADYVSVLVRDEIRKSLKRIPIRKIKKNWENYSEIKSQVITISEKISNIRQRKTGSVQLVNEYTKVIRLVIDTYKHFVKVVEPKLRK